MIVHIWRPPSLSELTAMIFNTELTHLGSVASHLLKLDLNLFWNINEYIVYMEACKAE